MSESMDLGKRGAAPAQRHPAPVEQKVVRPLPNSQDYIVPLNISEGNWGTLWGITARIGDTLEDMADQRYWELLAEKLRKDDFIKMRFPTDDRFEHFVVRRVWRVGNAISPNRAIVHHIPEWTMHLQSAEPTIDTGDFQVRFDGPKQGWSVWDTSRNAKIDEGAPSKDEAQRRAERYAVDSKRKQAISRQ